MFRVASSLHRDLCGGAFYLTEIVRGKFDRGCSVVLVQALEFAGAWDRNNPLLLSKQPGECDLSRGRPLPFCDPSEQIDQCLICLPGLRIKAGNAVADIGTAERSAFVNLAGEEALTQRAIWNEADSEFLEGRDYVGFRASPPQRVFALYRCDRLDGVCATDRLRRCFRKAEVFDLALLDQI